MIDARKSTGLTQKQLSEKTGISQADISKLESGNANPSLRTLQRLATGMGMKVKIEFQPIDFNKRNCGNSFYSAGKLNAIGIKTKRGHYGKIAPLNTYCITPFI